MSDEKFEYKRTIHFSGKPKDWVGWEEKFLAKAMGRGYYDLLSGDVEIPKSTVTQPTETEKKIRHLNSAGYLDMIMSVDHSDRDGRIAFNLIKGSKNKDYAHGNIREAYLKLKAKYAPKTAVVIAHLEQEFFDSKMKENSDPNDFLTDLEDLRTRMEEMGSVVADEQFLRRIVSNLTPDYEFVVQAVEERIGASVNPLTIEDLRTKLTLAYQRKKGHDKSWVADNINSQGSNEEEHLLIATDGQFKGRCHNCGKYGHKRTDCKDTVQEGAKNKDQVLPTQGTQMRTNQVPNRMMNQRAMPMEPNKWAWNGQGNQGQPWMMRPMYSGGFQGTCHYCGAYGHRIRDCRKRAQDMAMQFRGGGPNGNNAMVPREVYSPINSPGQGGREEPGEHGNIAQDLEPAPKDNAQEEELLFTTMDMPEEANYPKNLHELCKLMDDCSLATAKREAERQGWKVADTKEGELLFSSMDFVWKAEATEEEEHEESEDFQVGTCDNCGGEGMAYTLCTSCEDMGMIYVPEAEDAGPSWLRQVVDRAAKEKGLVEEEAEDWADKVHKVLKAVGIKTPQEIVYQWPSMHEDIDEVSEIKLTKDTIKLLGLMAYEELTEGTEFPEPGGEFALMALGRMTPYKMNRHTWLGDSGASTHMGNCDLGMYDVQEVKSTVRVGNGMTLTATKVGKKKLMVVQADGETMNCVLEDYKYVPELWVNLFSITKALRNKWNLSNEGEKIVVHRNNQRIVFDRFIPTEKGHVVGVEMVPRTVELGQGTLDIGCHLNVNYIHELLGHCNHTTTRKTAEYYGWKPIGKWEVCEACGIGKAKQKKLSKVTQSECTYINQRWYVDVSSVKKESSGGNKFWALVVDDYSDMCWSIFLRTKSSLAAAIIHLIKEMEELTGTRVKRIRLDNAGENKDLKTKAIDARLGIKFEFTSPNTPQFNGRVERKFTTLYAKARSMIASAGIPKKISFKLWCEAVRHATDIEITLVGQGKLQAPHKRYFQTDSKIVSSLSQFGEMAIVADQRNKATRGKLQERGKTCMYLGYAHNHASGVSRFWNVATEKVIVSRNVTWLGKTIGEWLGMTNTSIQTGSMNMVPKRKDPRRVQTPMNREPMVVSDTDSSSEGYPHQDQGSDNSESSDDSASIQGETQEVQPVVDQGERDEGRGRNAQRTNRILEGEGVRATRIPGIGTRPRQRLGEHRGESARNRHGMVTRRKSRERGFHSEHPLEDGEVQGNDRVSREMDRLASQTMNPRALAFGERQRMGNQRVGDVGGGIQRSGNAGTGTRMRTLNSQNRYHGRNQTGAASREGAPEKESFQRSPETSGIVEAEEISTREEIHSESDNEEVAAMTSIGGHEVIGRYWPEGWDVDHVDVKKAYLSYDHETGMTTMEGVQLANNDIPPEDYKDVFIVPKSFNDAWNHPDEFQRGKWREAVRKELAKMEEHKVWIKVPKATMAQDRRCVKCRWVLEIKRNGVFRARLVACGYSQVPGVDFTESYSPVVHDSTFRMLLTLGLIKGWKTTLIDVETAFLHGVLESDIYMDCPQGMEAASGECLLLIKTIYGLVQSARAFYKKLGDVLKRVGFSESRVDPCLYTRVTKAGEVHLAIYVDDIYMCGDEDAINVAIDDIKQSFKLKIEPEVKDYLSCELQMNERKTKCWLGQPHLLKRIKKDFGELVQSRQVYNTGGTPGFRFLKPKEGEKALSKPDQKLYRSGVGMLLYLVKLSRPDLANCVRELSKGMTEANYAAYKELMRIIKYVIDTEGMGLGFRPSRQGERFVMECFSDSDWGGDPDTRRSVSGYAIYFMRCLVMWRSKAQGCVSLSSAEAEWYALSEALKEVKFLYQLMKTIGIEIETPITVRVDNVATIFMAENSSTTARARHIDIRTCFIKELVEEGFVKLVFVKSEHNRADILTKNTTGEIMNVHMQDMVTTKAEILDDSSDENREGVRELFSTDGNDAGMSVVGLDDDEKYETQQSTENHIQREARDTRSTVSEQTRKIRNGNWCQRKHRDVKVEDSRDGWRCHERYGYDLEGVGEDAGEQAWIVVERRGYRGRSNRRNRRQRYAKRDK